MKRKGVCYDVGRVLEGSLQRPTFDREVVLGELRIIRDDLHCNSVRIQGLDLERMRVASECAFSLGLEVWFSPEMFERDEQETLQYLVKGASVAEDLRLKYTNIVFSLGSELSLFMNGILEGNSLADRTSRPGFRESIMSGKHNIGLNAFLAKANSAVRTIYRGRVTYFSLPFESVDWTYLDFAGIDLYRSSDMDAIYQRVLQHILTVGKPVVVGEFGCCTYRGAEKLGGQGWAVALGMIRDYLAVDESVLSSMKELLAVPERVDGHYVRDEDLQAREIVDQLGVFDSSGVDGTFIFTFVSPTSYYNEDPRFDSDMPSYSLVRSYPQKGDIGIVEKQSAKMAREIFGVELPPSAIARFASGEERRGETYPEMPWEPKKSFHAVSEYYLKH